MSQININERDTGDRTAAAGINLVTVLITLVVLAVLVWFLLTGPLAGILSGTGGGDTNITVNPPAQQLPSNGDESNSGAQGGDQGGQNQAPAAPDQ